jgi:hypothetical protein
MSFILFARHAVLSTLLSLTLIAAYSFGHGRPIHVRVVNNQLSVANGVTDPRGFVDTLFYDETEDAQLANLTLPGGVKVALTNLPGLDIVDMRPDSGLDIEILSRPDFASPSAEPRWLWHWNRAEMAVVDAPNDESLWIAAESGDMTVFQRDPPSPSTLRVANPRADELGQHMHFLRYLLDDDPRAAIGAYAFFARLTSPNYDRSDPFLIVLNNGLSSQTLIDAALVINAAAWLPGDFDRDDVLTVADLELLSNEIQHAGTNTAFDLNRDGHLNVNDVVHWVHELADTWIGDANLDGAFNSGDMVQVFQAGQYEDSVMGNSNWASGDWNADGDFTSTDLVLAFQDGGYESGPRPALLVPEPTLSAAFLLTVLAARRRRGHAKRLR